MTKFIATLGLITACGAPEGVLSSNGTDLIGNVGDLEVYNATENAIEEKWEARFGCKVDFTRWRVKILNQRNFKSGTETVRGRTDWFGLITLGRDTNEPVFETALAHEFAHVYEMDCLHKVDYEHEGWHDIYYDIGDITNQMRKKFNYDPFTP